MADGSLKRTLDHRAGAEGGRHWDDRANLASMETKWLRHLETAVAKHKDARPRALANDNRGGSAGSLASSLLFDPSAEPTSRPLTRARHARSRPSTTGGRHANNIYSRATTPAIPGSREAIAAGEKRAAAAAAGGKGGPRAVPPLKMAAASRGPPSSRGHGLHLPDPATRYNATYAMPRQTSPKKVSERASGRRCQ